MGNILKYYDEIVRSMAFLSEKTDTIFLGQSVAFSGNVIYKTLEAAKVPMDKRIEMPVFEEQQMGMSIGMSLERIVPVSIFPRMDFLMPAMNQLVNHLDKFSNITKGEFCPKVIIRTCIGSTKPLYPGVQHCSDYTEGLKSLISNVEVIKLDSPEVIYESYVKSYERTDGKSTILVEIGNLY